MDNNKTLSKRYLALPLWVRTLLTPFILVGFIAAVPLIIPFVLVAFVDSLFDEGCGR